VLVTAIRNLRERNDCAVRSLLNSSRICRGSPPGEPGSYRNPEATINMLLFLLDRPEVLDAVRRLRAGYGFAW
jgi:hypothetical protein